MRNFTGRCLLKPAAACSNHLLSGKRLAPLQTASCPDHHGSL